MGRAVQQGLDRLAAAVRHRSPVGKFLLVSAAQQIILQATAPVICVKP